MNSLCAEEKKVCFLYLIITETHSRRAIIHYREIYCTHVQIESFDL